MREGMFHDIRRKRINPFEPIIIREGGCSPTGTDTFTSSKHVNRWVLDFLKTYLHALHVGILTHAEVKTASFHAMTSIEHPVISKPRTAFQAENGLVRIEDSFIYTQVNYAGADYYVNLLRIKEDDEIAHEIVVSGTSPEAKRPDALRDILINESINNSMYRGRVLRIVEAPAAADDEDPMRLEVEIVKDMENSALGGVFLPAAVSCELRQFIECVTRYDELKTSMRYLLSGPPGTAKTQVVRCIAKACEGKATVLLASGGDARLNMLFSFANIFSPAILCVDDIDLIVGDRRQLFQKNVLGTFLQKLDGFVESHVFVLATTNDKGTVDLAASRPGRFDHIIDMGALEPRNYLDLVRRRTDDQEILRLFEDKDVLALLKSKKVVGAFLANLVKQVMIRKKTNGRENINKKELLNIVNRTYRGFYRAYEDPLKERIGFTNEKEVVETL
jgi:cell division protease FtsH